jgi:hypothetical protein
MAMNRVWWWLGDGNEEMSFQRVSDGWLFAAPLRWPRASYVVNDAQKAELARRLRWIYRANFLAILLVVVFLLPMDGGAKTFLPAFAALLIASLVLLFVAVRAAINPIVSGLTPVNRSISQKDAIVTQAATLSYAAIATMFIASLVLFAGGVGMGVTKGWDFMAVMSVTLFGACSVYFPMLWVVKSRTEAA